MTPSATGTLAATPLAHALVYARNRRLTGRLELTAEAGRCAAITLWCGSITFVETIPPGACPGGFFGAVVYELGYIDSAVLDATLLELSQTKRLHGEILLARQAITPAQRDEALVEQIHRKVHHLFSWPSATTYAFYDAQAPTSEPPVAVDPVGPVWRGIRDFPPQPFVGETMRRVGDCVLRATTGGSARLPPQEAALMQVLASQPMTLAEMKASTELPPARVELLVYLLVIAKCVESVSGVRTHPSTGALPASMPSGPVRIPSAANRIYLTPPEMPVAPPSSSRIPASSKRPVMPASSPRMPAVTAPGSTPRMPAVNVPGSTPRMPAVNAPGSAPRMPAVNVPGSTPRMPAVNISRPPPGTLAALRTPAEYGMDGILARAETVEDENYFEVLGVAESASAEGVRAAFMRLAKTWHPDKLAPDFYPVRTEVARIFSVMMHAHKTLCDPDARRTYVESLQAQTAARPRSEVLREITFARTKRNFDYVVQLCQELIDVDADDSEAIAIQAWASVREGEADDDDLRAALAKMDRAVNVDRTCDEAIFHRGLVQKRLGNVPAAFRDFARALQLNTRHVGAEREVRIFAMRARKGSGEHKLVAPLIEKLDREVRKK